MKLKQLLKKIKNNSPPSPQGGYTIIEGLVAMIIVGVLMSAVAPVIVFSVGTRVQARRIELGAQAARSYIDAVRSNPANGPGRAGQEELENVAGPDPATIIEDCNDGDYCDATTNKNLYCVDGDGNGVCKKASLTDMIVQAASWNGADGFEIIDQTTGAASPNEANYGMGYKMLVRVYRADAFQETSLCPSTGADCPAAGTQQSAVTNAIGNRRLPVVEMITEIGPTDDSFNNLRDRLE
ncbi:MAG: hormogonium polysaccharide secretion pseudopilin HpsB [Cyanobacteriota bacterium]|nr:hormogonium polysaccharide secretion pseudopilin HpsB [Cyanobacteriota bacterium]